jgi:hypothetical protein
MTQGRRLLAEFAERSGCAPAGTRAQHRISRPILCSALQSDPFAIFPRETVRRIEATLPTVSPDEFRREHNQDDCGYDQQSQLHPKVAEQAATACLTTLHVHLCGPPCDTAAQTADLPKGKASFHPFDFVCKTSSVRRNTSHAAGSLP